MAACSACGSDHTPDRFDYGRIPPLVREALDAHAATGRPTGSFSQAVLEHDLFEACNRADDENLWVLPVIVAYVWNVLPFGCHGSPEAVREWQSHRGLEGLEESMPESAADTF